MFSYLQPWIQIQLGPTFWIWIQIQCTVFGSQPCSEQAVLVLWTFQDFKF